MKEFKEKEKINLVWFKKDLRLIDHRPLFDAINEKIPVLLLFCFEPSIKQTSSWNKRHWSFMQASLNEMNQKLESINYKILVVCNEVVETLELIGQYFEIKTLFSHEETGIIKSYQRDIEVKKLCKKVGVSWKEYQNNGVIRALRNRDNWEVKWKQFMLEPILKIELEKLKRVTIPTDLREKLGSNSLLQFIDKEQSGSFQKAGTKNGFLYLNSFLKERVRNYIRYLAKAENSRSSCSRISSYLAYGNLSVRVVYQQQLAFKKELKFKRNINAFVSRLYWHCHFIQKFESEVEIQTRNLNPAFDKIRNEVDEKLLESWKKGLTGYPLIDASMRCLIETGFLNFRLRAMLVSFLCHQLWQPWQSGADFLAQQFLDFEPGIHYSQFQMQAGTTGINTIRVYNPEKQAFDNDKEAIFIKKWLPELAILPTNYALAPYKMTYLEQKMYNFQLGKDYPKPIVQIRSAKDEKIKLLWSIKKSEESKAFNKLILKKHVSEKRKRK